MTRLGQPAIFVVEESKEAPLPLAFTLLAPIVQDGNDRGMDYYLNMAVQCVVTDLTKKTGKPPSVGLNSIQLDPLSYGLEIDSKHLMVGHELEHTKCKIKNYKKRLSPLMIWIQFSLAWHTLFLVSIRQHDFAGLTLMKAHPDSPFCSLYGWFSMTHLLVKVVDIYIIRNTCNAVNSAIPSCLGDITPVTALNKFSFLSGKSPKSQW
jgi:hypothetical protein